MAIKTLYTSAFIFTLRAAALYISPTVKPEIAIISDPSGNPLAPFVNSTTLTNTSSSQTSGSWTSGSAIPSPIQKGISASCTQYEQANPGDFCSTFAQKNDITPAQLYYLNGALGSDGENCNTAFWSGYYYCVASNATTALGNRNSSTTATPTSTTNSIPTSALTPEYTSTIMSTVISSIISTVEAVPTSTNSPDPTPTPTATDKLSFGALSPTQPGIAPLCAQFAQAQTGDTCESFAAKNGITPLDLYERNTVLGSNGESCGTKFWVGYYYCVGGTD